MPPVSKLQAKLNQRIAVKKRTVNKLRKKMFGKVIQKKKSLGKFFMHRSDLISKLNKTNKNLFIKRKTIQTESEIKKIVHLGAL